MSITEIRPSIVGTSGTKRLPGRKLWTLEELARYLRVSPATLRRWTNAGKLACYRLGGNHERRFSAEQVRAFLARHERQAAG